MRLIFLTLALSISLTACGIDGPPPAGQVDGSPATGGFIPAE